MSCSFGAGGRERTISLRGGNFDDPRNKRRRKPKRHTRSFDSRSLWWSTFLFRGLCAIGQKHITVSHGLSQHSHIVIDRWTWRNSRQRSRQRNQWFAANHQFAQNNGTSRQTNQTGHRPGSRRRRGFTSLTFSHRFWQKLGVLQPKKWDFCLLNKRSERGPKPVFGACSRDK